MQCDSKGVSLVTRALRGFDVRGLRACVRAERVQWRVGQGRRTLLVKHYICTSGKAGKLPRRQPVAGGGQTP